MAKRTIPIDFNEPEYIYGDAPMEDKMNAQIPEADMERQRQLYEQFRQAMSPQAPQSEPMSGPEMTSEVPAEPLQTLEKPEMSELDQLRQKADEREDMLRLLRNFSRLGQTQMRKHDKNIDPETPELDEMIQQSDRDVKRYLGDKKRAKEESAFALNQERAKVALENAVIEANKNGIQLHKMDNMMGFLSGETEDGQQAAAIIRQRLQDTENQIAKQKGREPVQIPQDANLLELQSIHDFIKSGNGGLSEYQQAMLAERQKDRELDKERWQEGEERRVSKEERMEADQERERSRKLSKDITARYDKMKADPVYKEMAKQGISFDQADDLLAEIEAGNEVALGAIGTKMARAMGEVGVLTDADVERYIMAQSLVQKAKDKFGRAFMGQLSPETITDIKDVTKKMSVGFKKKKDVLVKEYVDQTYENFGKDHGISRDEIYQRMFGRPEAGAVPEGKIKVQLPNGQTGFIPKENVEEAKKRGAKEI